MERFDVLVVGTGSGMIVASTAVDSGYKTAIVDNGPMGGTCINRGCVPSKMLIYPADIAAIIGPEASILIQEIVNAMNTEERTFTSIVRAMYIHPAMPEVVQQAFGNLKPA